MSKIIELPEILANQIAAGEVVERPASVVKELLENSIDAGATKITIKVVEGGLSLVEVIDNGSGIEAEDVPKAILRHATSKIKTAADLDRIRTLGFRGEAMPSIASISQMTIETSVAEEEAGTKLVVKGGEIESLEAAPKIDGTRVKVENLFYNTPARLKYIRSIQSVLSNITDIVHRESLAHPDIAFTLINEGRTLIQTTGSGDLRQVIAQVYGLNNARKLVKIEASDLDYDLTGFVSLPELTRASRNYISIFLNGRYIKNYALNRAIIEGYGSKLMVGRFPLVVLSVQMDPQIVDVNVHPTKQEVKLSKEKELMTLISAAIREALSEETLIPQALENLAPQKAVSPAETNPSFYYDTKKQDFYMTESGQVADSNLVPPTLVEFPTDAEAPVERASSRISASPSQNYQLNLEESFVKDENDISEETKVEDSEDLETQTQSTSEEKRTFPELEYLAQLHHTYLLCQAPDGFYIVDQHAAQERVKYEYWRDKIGEVKYDQQSMLIPLIIKLPQADFLRVSDQKEKLQEAGIFLEEYGDSQFILREHPSWMQEREIESAAYEIIDLLLADKEISVRKYREALAITIACKSSIKAHDPIDPAGARSLLAQLAECENPYNCPHGRPSIVRFSDSEVEKMFRRIQSSHQNARLSALGD